MVSHLLAVLHALFIVNDTEHSTTAGRAHRVAAKRVEMQPRRQRRRNLWRRDDRAERQPVADAFGHRHDVRDDAVVLEAPVVGAGASKACLNFVSNRDAASLPHHLVDRGKVSGRKGHRATHALDRLTHEPGDAARRRRCKHVCHVSGILCAVSAKGAAVRVGVHRVQHAEVMRHRLLPSRVPARAHRQRRHAVVRVAQRHQVPVARVRARQQHRHVVRLGAGVDKVDVLEVARHLVCQLLCKLGDLVVQIDSRGVLQQLALIVDRLDHLGVAMAHTYSHDACKSVKVAPPTFVKQVLHLALHNHNRLLEMVQQAWAEVLLPQRQHLLLAGSRVLRRRVTERRQAGRRRGGGHAAPRRRPRYVA
mmetsp:Transcript_37368/g.110324  ORF Transcript_37368/g.110324 Transcript_37368/m.110324 type:complete len:364 (+) Transcript_37368:630-1721(+)